MIPTIIIITIIVMGRGASASGRGGGGGRSASRMPSEPDVPGASTVPAGESRSSDGAAALPEGTSACSELHP